MDLRRPTYVVLEAPSALAKYVRQLRRRMRSDYVSLPVEITLVGSSGAGVLLPNQSAAAVAAAIDEVAREMRSISVRFAAMSAFPGTGVYFFPRVPREAFDVLHQRLLRSGMSCAASPFAFTPHLTVVRVEDAARRREILSSPAPEGEFTFKDLAVYSQVGFDTRLHHRTSLQA